MNIRCIKAGCGFLTIDGFVFSCPFKFTLCHLHFQGDFDRVAYNVPALALWRNSEIRQPGTVAD